jgi:hypothetical protein
MFGYDKINLAFNYHWIFLVVLIGLSLLFTIYSYRFTLPPISNIKRIILISIRFLALILLISIFFEPVLFLEKRVAIKPSHLVFIDNSKSISLVDKKDNLKKFLDRIFSIENVFKNYQLNFYSFGKDVKQLNKNLDQIKFDESVTNLSRVFRFNDYMSKDFQKINPASITLLTDGIITDGSNPIYQAEKLGIPVYIFALGDSSKKKDVLIKNVVYNENVYLENQSTISVTVNNYGYQSRNINIDLLEHDKLIETKLITLDASGVNVVNFNYIPKEKSEKKLQIRIQPIDDEYNKNNNVYPFFIKVSEERTKVLIISGNPNPDFTFIKNILSTDETLMLETLTQIGADKFLEDNYKAKLDSSEILYLIGFPNKFTSEQILSDIKTKILNKKTPFFFLTNNDVDIKRVKALEAVLPIKLDGITDNYIKAQPDVNFNEKFDLINNINEHDWDKLPPILYPPNAVTAKPESRVISYIKVDNNKLKYPLIVQRSIASSRSITFVGKEFWRWKLQTATDNIDLFYNLIINSAKWLSAVEEDKQFKIKTINKFYSAGEDVEFVAELYDELLNPINDGMIEVEINTATESRKTLLNSLGNGLYEGKININKSGDYNYLAKVLKNNSTVHSATGKFKLVILMLKQLI